MAFLPGQATPATKKPKRPPVAAAEPEKPWPLPQPWQVDRFTLDNGMRVLVHTDRSAPLVAVGLMVDVGSRDEAQGQSGLAHFFEHMMFQGSKHSGKMEHMRALEGQGADLNANTSADRTWYYQVVPRPALELALWLEADRFANLVIDAANVENQRQTVMEELRERIENRPLVRSHLELVANVYASWAMGHPTIGSIEDLNRAPVLAFALFWHRWYTPNNCVLVLSGDIDVGAARPLVERTLGLVQRRADIRRQAVQEPAPTGHAGATLYDKLARTPAVHLAWKVPAHPDPDAYALDLLAEVLGSGDSSRLEKRLVRQGGLAAGYSAGTHGRRDHDLFQVYVELAEAGPAAIAETKRRIREEILDIAANGVTPEELRRAQIAFEAGWVRAAESPARRAELLAMFEVYHGDADKLRQVLPRYRAVNSAGVQRVARGWLTWDREVELEVLPSGATATPVGAKPDWIRRAERGIADAEARRVAAQLRAKEEAQRKAAEAVPPPAEPTPVALPPQATDGAK
ncbi:MAG: insulinase family protein [Deltaproteobacteria bacterium]|nr:insulinase family protein [Deltaproteobacteria bacterium]